MVLNWICFDSDFAFEFDPEFDSDAESELGF